ALPISAVAAEDATPAPAEDVAEVPSPGDAAAAVEPADGDGAEAAVAIPPVTVTVEEAGEEPRRPLRLALEAGAEQRVAVTLELSMAMTVGEREMPKATLPKARLVVKVTVTAVDEAGGATYDLEIEDAGFDEELPDAAGVVARLEAGLAAMKGLRGRGAVSARGVAQTAALPTPAGAGPEVAQLLAAFRQALAQLATPLPEEPVGAGARFLVTQQVTQGGLAVTQTTTLSLTSLDAAGFAADVTVTQAAEPGAGIAVEGGGKLTRFEGKGEGKTTVAFGRLVPTAASSTVHTEAAGELGEGAAAQAMSLAMDVTMGVTPAEEATP
ncbi:MAG: hypothetical protein KC635_11350, partial [Myxococcales bacterium]|nr:hypothetical protein [Myxococcales bacterium]